MIKGDLLKIDLLTILKFCIFSNTYNSLTNFLQALISPPNILITLATISIPSKYTDTSSNSDYSKDCSITLGTDSASLFVVCLFACFQSPGMPGLCSLESNPKPTKISRSYSADFMGLWIDHKQTNKMVDQGYRQ